MEFVKATVFMVRFQLQVRQEREWLAMRREWLINEQRRIPDWTLTPEQRRTFEHYFWLVDERYRILAWEEQMRNFHNEQLREERMSPEVTLKTGETLLIDVYKFRRF